MSRNYPAFTTSAPAQAYAEAKPNLRNLFEPRCREKAYRATEDLINFPSNREPVRAPNKHKQSQRHRISSPFSRPRGLCEMKAYTSLESPTVRRGRTFDRLIHPLKQSGTLARGRKGAQIQAGKQHAIPLPIPPSFCFRIPEIAAPTVLPAAPLRIFAAGSRETVPRSSRDALGIVKQPC